VVLKDVQGQAICDLVGVYEANAIALEIEKCKSPADDP